MQTIFILTLINILHSSGSYVFENNIIVIDIHYNYLYMRVSRGNLLNGYKNPSILSDISIAYVSSELEAIRSTKMSIVDLLEQVESGYRTVALYISQY